MRPGKQPALPPAAKIALSQLRNALTRDGKAPPASSHIPANSLAVDYDLWRRYCYLAGISSTDTQEAKQKAFARAAEKLLGAELVKRWDSWVWIP
jgi:hypothetical protein